jgi:hypothetical protein
MCYESLIKNEIFVPHHNGVAKVSYKCLQNDAFPTLQASSLQKYANNKVFFLSMESLGKYSMLKTPPTLCFGKIVLYP